MDYKVLDMEKYYRKDIYRHFTMDCKCSVMITSKIDVSELVAYSKQTGTKFYINFLYVLTKALNTRDDYKMRYLYQEDKLVVQHCALCFPRGYGDFYSSLYRVQRRLPGFL